MSRVIPFRKVYGPAAIIAAITIFGLLSALFGDGLWDTFSWIALVIPLGVIVWKYSRATRME
jgi:hypothetical protein